VNLFDVVVIVILIAAVLIGIGSGALPQLGGLAGAVAGAGVAIAGLPLVAQVLDPVPPDLRAFVVLGGILFLVGIGEAIGSAIGRTMAVRLGGGVLGSAEAKRSAGASSPATQSRAMSRSGSKKTAVASRSAPPDAWTRIVVPPATT
jgi:hypothetical protein